MTPTLSEQTAALKRVVQEKRGLGDVHLADALQAALNTLVGRAASAGNVVPAAELENLPQAPLTLYKQFEGAYHAFCQEETGLSGKMDGPQGKALHSIIVYLTQNCRTRDAAGALESWKYMLSHWHQLNEFLQKQKALTSINRYLLEMLDAIRKASKPAPKAVPDPHAERKRAKLLDELEDARRSIRHLESCTPYAEQARHLALARQAKAGIEAKLAALGAG